MGITENWNCVATNEDEDEFFCKSENSGIKLNVSRDSNKEIINANTQNLSTKTEVTNTSTILTTEIEMKGDLKSEKKILSKIRELDTGEGADYGELNKSLDMSEEELESQMNEFLSNGTCFEPRPGRVKVL